MKLLSLLALVVAVSANSIRIPESGWLQSLVPEKHIVDKEYKAGREYKFFYNGQLATGIPGSSQQHSATRIQALVSLVFKSEQECLMKIVDCRFGKLNDRLQEPRKIQAFTMFEQIDVNNDLMPHLKTPVKFTYTNGMISDIVFDGSEQPWSANIKRGVLNMLQVNLDKQRQIHSGQQQQQQLQQQLQGKKYQQFYTTMEKTIEGECPTMYTITSQPCKPTALKQCRDVDTPVLNVTKSIDFENCQQRPDVRYNERFQQICPTCENRYDDKERTLRSSTVMKMNMACGTEQRRRCLIERAEVDSQYHFVLMNSDSNMLTTYVCQTLELVKTCDIETQIDEPRQPIDSDSQMMYTLDWDVNKERFFIEGQHQFQEKTPYSDLKDKMHFVEKILEKMVHFMRESVEEEAPRQFARLVKVFRMLKANELKQCHEKFVKNTPQGFTREEHKKIKSLIVDAVAMCGTRDCVNHLVHCIEQGHISTTKGAMAIKKLTDIRVVGKDIIDRIMGLCETGNKCERCPVLKQSVYLTCGSLMRAMCVDTRDKLALEFKQPRYLRQQCDDQVKTEFVRKMVQKIESATGKYDKILCIKALSNAALDVSLVELQKIITNVDKKYSTIVRIEAVLACRQLADQIPKKVISVLMPIYTNRRQPAELRIAAFYQIMICLPEKPILDQLTRSLRTERQLQVASFTYTMMQTMANSTNPCKKRLADDLRLSLRHGRYMPVSQWLTNSKFVQLVQKCSKTNKMCYSIDVASSMSNMTVVPKALAATLNINAGHMWTPRMFTVGFTQQGLGHILGKLLRSHSHNLQSSLNDLLSGKYELPSPKFNYRQELKDLFNKLNIEERQQQHRDGESFGTVYMKFKNQEYGFVPLSKEIIPEELQELLTGDVSINKIVKRAKSMLKDFVMPFDVQMGTFLHEQSRKIPTTLGMPLVASFKMPTVMQATGMLKVEVDQSDPLKKIKLVFRDVKPSMVSTGVFKVECWSPIVNSGLKLLAQGKVYTPFDGQLSLDMKKNPTEVIFTWMPKFNREHQIVVLQTRPITTTLVWPKQLVQWKEPEEKTIHGSEWTRVQKHNVEFGEHTMGVKFHSRAFWHYTPNKRVPTTPVCPFSGPNKYVLTMQPGYEMPNEITVRVTGKLFKSQDKKMVNVDFDKFFDDSSEDFLSRESSEEQGQDTSSDYYKKYQGKRPVNNQIEIDIFTKGSSVKRECQLSTQCMCGDEMKSCKCNLKIERTPVPTIETEKWKGKCDIELLYPKTPYTVSQLTSDKQFMCRINTVWGPVSSMNKKCDIKIVAEQSQRMQQLKDKSLYKQLHDQDQHREQHKSLFSPVAQYKQTVKYGLLDEIKVDIDYDMTTSQQEFFNQWFRKIKHTYYGQTVVRQVGIKNEEGRLRVKLNIDPINRRYCNMTVMSQHEQCMIRDMPLSMPVNALNMRRLSTPSRSAYHMMSKLLQPWQAQCEVRTDRVQTFDKVKYNVPTSTCYTVLAKDCHSAEKSKFAVLIKKLSSSTEKKELKIVTPTTKLTVRALSSDRLECHLNGDKKPCDKLQKVQVHGEHVALRCQKYDGYLKCELPEAGIRVYYDGLSANIKVSPLYRQQVCGLCGHYDQEQDDDLQSADRRSVSSGQMLQSYLVEDSQQQCEHEMSQHKSSLSWDSLDSEDLMDKSDLAKELMSSPLRKWDQDIEPIKRTKVIEQSDEICFSKQPVKTCPRNTYTVDYKQQPQKVVYCCLPRNDIKAEHYHRRASRHQIIDEVDSLTASFTETEIVPKTCRHY